MPAVADSPEPILDPPAETLKELKTLSAGLDEAIPAKALDRNLLIATWNIRAFGDMTDSWKRGKGDSPKRNLLRRAGDRRDPLALRRDRGAGGARQPEGAAQRAEGAGARVGADPHRRQPAAGRQRRAARLPLRHAARAARPAWRPSSSSPTSGCGKARSPRARCASSSSAPPTRSASSAAGRPSSSSPCTSSTARRPRNGRASWRRSPSGWPSGRGGPPRTTTRT